MTMKAGAAASLRASLEAVTTPIDFKDLQARGILTKTDGPWWQVSNIHHLPPHARRQIVEVRGVPGGSSEVRFRSDAATRRSKALLAKVFGPRPSSTKQ
jgi:hypothetical protein